MNSINIRCLLLIVTFYCLYLPCSGELDFQFNDELHVKLPQSTSQLQHHHSNDNNSQPVAVNIKGQHHHHKNTYSKEISKCPYTEDKIMLSLVLKSNDWSNIIDNKKSRVLNKLSKFFNIPKEYIKLESISRPDIIEMNKWSIKRGPNKCNSNRHHGKVEFMIGCGQSSYFIIGNSISRQISHQMKDGAIDDITGVDFGWWVIWRKRVSNRVSRKVRDVEGSGEEDDDYVYDDEDEEPLTELPTTPTHAHRHHHGVPKSDFTDSKIEKISLNSNIITTKNDNIKHKKNDFKPLQGIDKNIDELLPTTLKTLSPLTSTTIKPIAITTLKSSLSPSSSASTTILNEDIVKSVSQLESVISKTIENNEKIKDMGTMIDTSTLNNSKKKSNKRNKIDNIRSSTIYNINIDKSKEDDFIIDGVNNNGNSDTIAESITYRIPIGKSTTLTTSIPLTTYKNLINVNTEIATTPSTTTATTDIYLNLNSNHNINNRLNLSSSLKSLQSSSSPLPHSSLISSQLTSTSIPTIETSTINQKLVNLDQITQISTVITAAKNNDETSVAPPLTDDIVVVTNNNNYNINNKNIKTTTPSITVPATTTTNSNTEINPFTSTVEYELSTTTSMPTTIASLFTSTISSATTTLASVKSGEDEDGYTNATPKEDEILNETTTNRIDDTTVSNEHKSVLFEISTNGPTTTTIQAPVSTTTTTTQLPTTEYIEPEQLNTPPIIKNRLPKQPVTAGKLFSLFVPVETFYDNEDETNLRLELFDKNGHELKPNSWLQFNPETREIYGLPLEDAVSRYNYRLTATDSGNETVSETLDISVQQHKGHRSVNHEISLGVKLNQKFLSNIDWQIRLVKGIADTLKDDSSLSIVVREVRQNKQDPYFATFIYTNESLPKDKCPEAKLDELLARLDREKLTESVMPELTIKSITGQLIGPCQKVNIIKTKPTPRMTKNSAPIPRNQVDRVNATVGHLLVYKVPPDTFYDDEDTTDLKLTLLTNDRNELGPRHWLQFDSKNHEFYGIPRAGDYGSEEYILVAEDREGLTASDALIVVVNHSSKREYNVYFKVFLGIRHELFNSHMQRKFVERIAKLFNDPSPQYIQIRSITTNHDADGTIVNFFNTTLHRNHRNRCPEDEIEMVRNVWFSQDSILRDRVKKTIGNEFDITNVQMMPLVSCYSHGDIHRDIIPIKTDENNTSSTFKDDYMLTFVLPAIVILTMILLALIIACFLHRRRLTGKMELGDEEERKSFRSKGIPVIFQDELDEKPEIGNKSPIILKDEKPPLLPPSYNSTNIDGDNDCDEYVPPPAVIIGGREIRGKSPVTPSYRKPPPYVSP